MNNFTVYRHTTPSGKVYIGITRQNPIRRWRPDGSGYKENIHFWNAICCYGWDNITHEIIASGLTKDEACEMEIALIAEHDSMNPNKGYNGTIGGEHPPFSEETRRKISEAAKARDMSGARNPNYGNHKLAGENNPHYGKRFSAEARQRMSEGRKGKGTQPKSEATKQKMRENHAGGHAPKQVLCVETGEIYKSINDAARAVNINKKVISNCCRGIIHYNTAGGCHWQFL